MNILKKGTKVRIVKDLKAAEPISNSIGVTSYMLRFQNKIVTICRLIPSGTYKIVEDDGRWVWAKWMFTKDISGQIMFDF